MKRILLPLMLFASVGSFAQGGLLKKANDLLGKSKSGSGLSTEEIVSGLKEALSLGATNGANKLSAVDGFFAMLPSRY